MYELWSYFQSSNWHEATFANGIIFFILFMWMHIRKLYTYYFNIQEKEIYWVGSELKSGDTQSNLFSLSEHNKESTHNQRDCCSVHACDWIIYVYGGRDCSKILPFLLQCPLFAIWLSSSFIHLFVCCYLFVVGIINLSFLHSSIPTFMNGTRHCPCKSYPTNANLSQT